MLPRPDECVDDYLQHALAGQRHSAIRMTLDLRERGADGGEIVVDLLSRAQAEIGERWYRDEASVAEEHLTTGISTAALIALTADQDLHGGLGHTVAVSAEGDWHGLVPEMFGAWLRSLGIRVSVLGASTPADAVADYLSRQRADSLAVSCSMPIFFLGVIRLVDAAHARGVPVMVGGRAFGNDGRWVERLGADAWAPSAVAAAPILERWRAEPPVVDPTPVPVDPAVLALASRARTCADEVVARVESRRPHLIPVGERARYEQDVELAVAFTASALLVDDDDVFVEFVEWLAKWMIHRDLPVGDLAETLAEIAPVVEPIAPSALRVLEAGRARL